MKKLLLIFVFMTVLIGLGGCTEAEQPVTSEPSKLTVMSHDSFAVSEDIITAFEQENNVQVVFLKSGDTGAAINRAILSKDAPVADVFYGVDNSFLSRALEADIFETYDSPQLENIDPAFKLDDQNRALPVDFGDVCINYDKAYFNEKGVALPESLSDLVKPEYAGLLAVENPAVSSPGLSFLMATIAEFGEEGYLDFWAQLRDNGVVVVNDWETAYYTNFSGSSGQGEQPMVVSYASSPPAEVIFASEELDDAPTASLVGENMCFRQIEFVGILKGTAQSELAQKFVDYMLGKTFQEDLPMQMFVFPVSSEAELPVEFSAYAQISEAPAELDSELIAVNREAWIEAWTEVVLR
jgi:thiamine transport system substrate-binding protein